MPSTSPHICPKCFESVTLIQPQHKGGAFKGPAKGHCLNGMDKRKYDLTILANKREILKRIEKVVEERGKIK